jgi:PAS domain S-box-containing protein
MSQAWGSCMSDPFATFRKDKPGDIGSATVQALLSPSLLESIPDAIVAVNQDGIIIHVNSQTEALFGYTRNELIGKAIETLVPERYRVQHQGHRGHFGAQPKIRRMGAGLDLFGKRRDGSEFPVEISLSPIQTEQGLVVLSAIRDISDQKRIEEELRRAHEELNRRKNRELWDYQTRLSSIVDSSEDAIIGKNLDGIITHWNRGAEHIYGYSADEVVGKSISILAPADRTDEIPMLLAKIRDGEPVRHFESVRLTKDGRQLNVSLSVSPMHDAEGNIVGASVIGRDITAQKRAEDQLRQAQKMEAIGRLAGGIAHDFNNVLSIVAACTELLRTRVKDEEAANFVETIVKAAERGASLTRQLLAFSRKQVTKPVVLDLNERFPETRKLLRPLMGDDIEISILPRSPSALVEMDPGLLDQVVLNLAVNARDAMPHGGKFVIETALMTFDEAFTEMHRPLTAGKYVMLAISDTGLGMDETTVSRIFEPFFTTKDVGKGTGLGLSTVYGIVRQSGGHIWVYSEPGRGTTFKVYLPSAEEKIGMVLEPEAEEGLVSGKGKTLLVVEDDDLLRNLTSKMLQEHGYTVIDAADGKTALEKLDHNHIDLVLTDVVMRGMSGPELVLRLIENHPEMKVVYMSGYTGELILERDLLKPGISLLEKPFTRSSLLKTIQSAIA